MATQPVLGGTTMAHPSTYEESYGYRGAAVEMANGSIAWDLVTTTAKRVFTLGWKNISTTARNTIHTAFDTVKTATQTFTAPTGSSYTVTRAPGQDELEWSAVADGQGNLRWSTTMQLREV